ncbi:MAG: hypothetical protein OCC49_09800 [Fibrobacterales bacterium]
MKKRLAMLCIASLAIPSFAQVDTLPEPTSNATDTTSPSSTDPFDSYSTTPENDSTSQYPELTEPDYSNLETTDLVTETELVVQENPQALDIIEAKPASESNRSFSVGLKAFQQLGYYNHTTGQFFNNNSADDNFETDPDKQATPNEPFGYTRAWPELAYKWNDNLSFMVRLQTARILWGKWSGAKGTGDSRYNTDANQDGSINHKHIYADIDFNPLSHMKQIGSQELRFGSQSFNDPSSMIINRDAFGIKYTGHFVQNMVKFQAGWFHLKHKSYVILNDTSGVTKVDTRDQDGEMMYTANISANLLDSSITAGFLYIGRRAEQTPLTSEKTQFFSQNWFSPYFRGEFQLPFGALDVNLQASYFNYESNYTTYDLEIEKYLDDDGSQIKDSLDVPLYITHSTGNVSDTLSMTNIKSTSPTILNSGLALSLYTQLTVGDVELGLSYLRADGKQDQDIDEESVTTSEIFYSSSKDNWYNNNKLQFLTNAGIIDDLPWGILNNGRQNGADGAPGDVQGEKGGVNALSVWAFYKFNENIKVGVAAGIANLVEGHEIQLQDADNYKAFVDAKGKKYWSQKKKLYDFDTPVADRTTSKEVDDSDLVDSDGDALIGKRDDSGSTLQLDEYDSEAELNDDWEQGVTAYNEIVADIGTEINIQAEIVAFEGMTVKPFFAVLLPGNVVIEGKKDSNLIKTGVSCFFEF